MRPSKVMRFCPLVVIRRTDASKTSVIFSNNGKSFYKIQNFSLRSRDPIDAGRHTFLQQRQVTTNQLHGIMEDVDIVTYVVILSQIHSNQVAKSKSKLKEQNRKSYTELGAT